MYISYKEIKIGGIVLVKDIYQFYEDLLDYKKDDNVEILKKIFLEKNLKIQYFMLRKNLMISV